MKSLSEWKRKGIDWWMMWIYTRWRKIRKTFLEKNIEIRVMTRYLEDLERMEINLKMEKHLLRKTDKELLFCSSLSIKSGGTTTDNLLKNTRPRYLRSAFIVQKEIVRYYCKKFSELPLFISELWRKWKRRGGEVEEVGILQKKLSDVPFSGFPF